jgi:hypothetical protein
MCCASINQLKGNNIGSEGVRHIMQGLQHNTSITNIDLAVLTPPLTHSRPARYDYEHQYLLTCVVLCCASINQLKENNIGSEGVRHIMQGLQHNTSITSINLAV